MPLQISGKSKEQIDAERAAKIATARKEGKGYYAGEEWTRGAGYRPEYAGSESQFGESGLLKDIYQLKTPEAIKMASLMPEFEKRYSTKGLEKFRGEALREGPSAWGQMALERQRVGQKGAVSDLARQQAAGQAQARSELAMRGGISGGARERLARGGARDLMAGRAQIAAQGRGDVLGLLGQDEQTRLAQLGQLPGMEAQAIAPWQQMATTEQGRQLDLDRYNQEAARQASQFNIEGALRQRQADEQAKLKQYEEAMKTYAAERTAVATENAGKK